MCCSGNIIIYQRQYRVIAHEETGTFEDQQKDRLNKPLGQIHKYVCLNATQSTAAEGSLARSAKPNF